MRQNAEYAGPNSFQFFGLERKKAVKELLEEIRRRDVERTRRIQCLVGHSEETDEFLKHEKSGRASVTSASKADEAAHAERSVFELHPVQSTAALLCAGQVETTIEESTFESQLSVSHAAVRTVSVREQSRGKQGGRDLNTKNLATDTK